MARIKSRWPWETRRIRGANGGRQGRDQLGRLNPAGFAGPQPVVPFSARGAPNLTGPSGKTAISIT